MKQTLLQITQDILSAMSGDEVNSINDTTEAQQVATCIKTAYFNMVSKYDLPEHNQLFQLSESADITKPVLMTRPAGVSRVEWIKYWNNNPNSGGGATTTGHGVNTDIVTTATVTPSWSMTAGNEVTPGFGSITWIYIGAPSGDGTPAVGQAVTVTCRDAGSDLILVGTITAYTASTSITVDVTQIIGSINVVSGIATTQGGTWTFNSGGITQPGPGYETIRVIDIEDYLSMTNNYNILDSNVSQMELVINNSSTGLDQHFTFKYKTDAQPKYCCIVDEQYFVFDAFDLTQEDQLKSVNSLVSGWVIPSWSMTDSFYPNLDENMFPMLYNEAKALAFFELKQTPHQKAEQEITRQRSSLQKYKNIAERPSYFDALPNFGRRGGGTGR